MKDMKPTIQVPSNEQIQKAFKLAIRQQAREGCIKASVADRLLIGNVLDRLAMARGWYFDPEEKKVIVPKIRKLIREHRRSS